MRLTLLAVALAVFSFISSERASAAAGDIYVTEYNGTRVSRIDVHGAKTVFASAINGPTGAAFDSSGNLYLTEYVAGNVYKYDSAGARTTFASGLVNPGAIAIDKSDNVFIAATGNSSIYKFSPAGVRSGFAGNISANGLAFDKTGNLLASDANSKSVIKFTPAAARSTFASGFSSPIGITMDAAGTIYVADFGAQTIYQVASDGTKTPWVTNAQCYGLAMKDGYVLASDFVLSTGTVRSFPSGQVIASDMSNPGGIAVEPPRGFAANISTRVQVQNGEKIAIAGFIVTGSTSKKVLLRGLGPSLGSAGIANPLADPVLELDNSAGQPIAANNDWKSTQQTEIQNTGIAPSNDRESAILITLAPGAWTAKLSGNNFGTGVGLVEVYDLDQGSGSVLANISTRGFVDTGNNVMIGGFILGGNGAKVIVRALGPSLSSAGISDYLADPTLDLRDSNGNLLGTNDNWQSGAQQVEIQATGIPPTAPAESAIVATLPNGSYTAIVSGVNATRGVGLVEVYGLQ